MDFETLAGLCGLEMEEFARARVSVDGWERPSILAFANLARFVARGRQGNLVVPVLQLAGAVLDLGLGRSCEHLVRVTGSVIDRLRSGERAAAEELWQYARSYLGGGDSGDEPDGVLERFAQQDSWFKLLMGMRWRGELSPRLLEPIVGNGVWLPRGCTAPGEPQQTVTVTSLVLIPKSELRETASRMRSPEVVAVMLAAPAVTPSRDHLPEDLEEAFLVETSGLIDRMEHILLEYEGESAGAGSMNELFRLAHSVKGNSGAVGLAVLADLAHVVEDVLDVVRSGRLILDTQMITILLVAIDCMRKLTRLTEPKDADVEQALACALELAWQARPVLQAQAGTDSFAQASSAAVLLEVVSSAVGLGCHVEWRIPLDEQMPYARAVQVVSELRRHVKVTAAEPPEGEWPDLRPGVWIKLLVTNAAPDELSRVIERLGPIGEVRVSPVCDHGRGSDADLGQVQSSELVQGGDTAALRRGLEGIRVSSSALDELLGLVGETLSDTHRVAAAVAELLQRIDGVSPGGNGSRGVSGLGGALRSALGRLEHTVAGLQRQVLEMRLVPLRTLFVRYHRIVRDACLHLGKEAQLLTEGEDVQVDKQVIELLSDPLTHLIRNAIDHGIEAPDDRVASGKPRRGTVWLRARSDGGHVVVELCDDGRGIDMRAVQERARQEGIPVENLDESGLLGIIFRPGFSCARSPTRYSGRGVGLDVVRSNLAQLRGSVTVTFKPGCGTTFYLRIPASTAITRLLLVRAGHATYGIPLDQVREVFRAAGCPTTRCGSVQVVRVRERTVPLRHLAHLLLRADAGGTAESCSRAVLVQQGELTVAIGVDDLCGIVDSVVRPVQVPGGQSLAVSGVALLGDGRVVLVVDGGQLVRSATGKDGL